MSNSRKRLNDQEIMDVMDKSSSEDGDGSDEEILDQVLEEDSAEGSQGSQSETEEGVEINNPESDWVDDIDEPEVFNFNEIPRFVFPNEFDFVAADSKDIFNLFFTNDLMNLIINETNDYAEKMIAELPRPYKKYDRSHLWKPLTREELEDFFGIAILMGLWRLPTLENYWNRNGIYKNSIFPKLMTRNRFVMILKYLHFTKNEAATSGDLLAKIRPIMEGLRLKFLENRYPEKELALDESMIPWRGRLKCRQYIKNKKKKYGIKLYKICSKDGFVLNFIPYSGKSTTTGESSKTEQIVFKLAEPYLDKGHILYMDNYYNSVNLTKKLIERKTHIVGTLNKNRKGNPKVVIAKKLKKGEVIWKTKSKILVTKWKDRRDVLMISSKHNHSMVETFNKRKQMKEKPKCVQDYNEFMGGVDLSDQLSSYYSTPRRSLKWYKKVFFYLLDMTIINSYIMAKTTLDKFQKFKVVDFREALVKVFLAKHLTEDNANSKNKKKQHYFESIPSTIKKKYPTKRCQQCDKNKVRSESRYYCPLCPNDPALCVVPCFKNWHYNL